MIMSENKPITPKEKMLISVLVKLYSKEKLEEELHDCVQSVDNSSEYVLGAGKLLGIPRNDLSRLGIQYLNYAVDNYEKIKDQEFPEDIERIVVANFYADETESVIMYHEKRVRVNTLKKFIDEVQESVWENYYEYDPDDVRTEWGDSDFISLTPHKDDTYISDYVNNVIE